MKVDFQIFYLISPCIYSLPAPLLSIIIKKCPFYRNEKNPRHQSDWTCWRVGSSEMGGQATIRTIYAARVFTNL